MGMGDCNKCEHVVTSDGSCSKRVEAKDCKKYRRAPECESCGTLTRRFGRQTSLSQVGPSQICGRCKRELGKFGFLRVTTQTFMLPDGQITTDKPRAYIDLLDGWQGECVVPYRPVVDLMEEEESIERATEGDRRFTKRP